MSLIIEDKEDFNRQRFPEVIQKRMKRHTGWDKRKDQAGIELGLLALEA